MPHVPSSTATRHLLARSRQALGTTQNEIADLLGVTRRTVGRWEGGRGAIGISELQKLASAVHGTDPALASEIAIEAGTTLHHMGLTARPATAAASAGAPAPPARPFPPVELMLDSILHVAAQALTGAEGAQPIVAVQAVLSASLARAKGLGLTLDELVGALAKGSLQPTERPRSPKR
jgi:transcriptional regulator with XRE-family HTH domain